MTLVAFFCRQAREARGTLLPPDRDDVGHDSIAEAGGTLQEFEERRHCRQIRHHRLSRQSWKDG